MTEKFLPLLLALVVLCSSLSVLLPRSPLHRVCFLILDAATRFYRRRYTWGDGRPFCVISEVPGSSDEDYFEEVYNVTILPLFMSILCKWRCVASFRWSL
ncbi:hypothetical protein AAHE18_03G271800 [Arachis hypogaea]